ncbi:MAG: BrnT family toxin [Gammaproteobacteria bacterium]|nr:BrnT family toxin [Gammaproteobacteria bacterium]
MIFNKEIEWDAEKNERLKSERDLSFEEIVAALLDGKLLDVVDHPSRNNQQIIVVEVNGYAVFVPFVSDESKIFLKTAYKNSQATKKHLKGSKNEH